MSDLFAERIPLADVPLSPLGLGQALHSLDVLVASGGRHFVCFCEANLLYAASRDRRVIEALQDASMVLPDGIIVASGARALAHRRVERVAGPSFILEACRLGVGKGYRHFFYGGAPGVADALAQSLCLRFAGLEVVGAVSPPFRRLTSVEELKLQRMIKSARPHLLWVGLGGPKQELWMAEHLDRLDVPVMLGVGAAFDFHSGKQAWAPAWVRNVGMEWAFRAITGGRRVFFRNVRCVSGSAMLVAGELCRKTMASGHGGCKVERDS